MSTRPQPSQKQMIIQQVLLAVVLFMGLNLVCNRPKTERPPRTIQQIIGDVSNPASGAPPTPKLNEQWDLASGSMAWANATLHDQTIMGINTELHETINKQLEAKQISAQEANRLKLYGDLLVADAQYKSSIAYKDTNKLRTAYNAIASAERTYRNDSLWATQSFEMPKTLAKPERFPWTEWKPNEMFLRVREELSEKNRHDLTYGIFPGYQIIDFLVSITGKSPWFSYAFACFLLALAVRAVVYPLAQRQLMWGRKMQQLQPLMKEIREQYTDKKTKQITNQVEFNAKTMELYREYGINPAAGCLPALIQFPLFITVYQFMLHYQFEFQKGYFLWINPATSKNSNGIFAPDLGQIDYTLLVIYGISMLTSTLLMPVSDPNQVKQQRIMGIGMSLMVTVFMFLGGRAGMVPVPAAFVLYWTFTNILATLQSLRAYRLPIPPLEKVNSPTGGVFPMKPFGGSGSGNGSVNGNGKSNGTIISTGSSTGTPAKHKPKKRK